jgi:hypothetical protein
MLGGGAGGDGYIIIIPINDHLQSHFLPRVWRITQSLTGRWWSHKQVSLFYWGVRYWKEAKLLYWGTPSNSRVTIGDSLCSRVSVGDSKCGSYCSCRGIHLQQRFEEKLHLRSRILAGKQHLLQSDCWVAPSVVELMLVNHAEYGAE